MPPYRACLVDVFDTVLSVDFAAYAQGLADRMGVAVDDFAAAASRWDTAVMEGRATVRDALGDVLRTLGHPVSDRHLDDLVADGRRLLHDLTVLHEDAEPFLAGLRSAGVRTALVSNCSDNTRPLLEGLGLALAVDEVVLSCEVAAAKPDQRIYRVALDRLGVTPREAVFVDDQAAYCAGAAEVGIHSVLIDRFAGTGDVTTLRELAALF